MELQKEKENPNDFNVEMSYKKKLTLFLVGFYCYSIFSLSQNNICINALHLGTSGMTNENCPSALSSSLNLLKRGGGRRYLALFIENS